jgi:hypothetical protein
MKNCLQLLSQAISSGHSLLSQAFPDPFEAARHLMNSPRERERMLGLRKLQASKAPEAPHVALVHYRFAASPVERIRAENCLATLTVRSSESAGEAALAILHSQYRLSKTFTKPKLLRHSASNLSRVLQTGRVSKEDLQAIDCDLTRWAQIAPLPASQRAVALLNQLASPRLSPSLAREIEEKAPSTVLRLRSRLHFTFALQAVSSEHADNLRVGLCHNLEPGAYADVVLKTIRPHLARAVVRNGVSDLLNNWRSTYGTTSPDTQAVEYLLLRHGGGIVGPTHFLG